MEELKRQRHIRASKLEPFLREFSEKHRARPVTLEVLSGATWKIEESGMALVGLDVDTRAAAAPAVDIVLGEEGSCTRHLRHTVTHVRGVMVELDEHEQEQRLVIEGKDGAEAVLFIG